MQEEPDARMRPDPDAPKPTSESERSDESSKRGAVGDEASANRSQRDRDSASASRSDDVERPRRTGGAGSEGGDESENTDGSLSSEADQTPNRMASPELDQSGDE